MKIALGADHAGYELKRTLETYLAKLGHTVLNQGVDSLDPADYPDYAKKVAQAVASAHASMRWPAAQAAGCNMSSRPKEGSPAWVKCFAACQRRNAPSEPAAVIATHAIIAAPTSLRRARRPARRRR